MKGGIALGRPINQSERDKAHENVRKAIAQIKADRLPLTRSNIAQYLGLSAAYLSKRDSSGNKNFLGKIVDDQLAAGADESNPIICDLKKQIKDSEKIIRAKEREIKKLSDGKEKIEAENAKLRKENEDMKTTLNTLYQTFFDSQKEEMRKTHIS